MSCHMSEKNCDQNMISIQTLYAFTCSLLLNIKYTLTVHKHKECIRASYKCAISDVGIIDRRTDCMNQSESSISLTTYTYDLEGNVS